MHWLPRNRFARLGLAIACIIVGIAGLLLPILPGWAFIFVGLFVLAEDFHWARRFVDWTLDKLERYGGDTARRYVENYRRHHPRRETAGDERSGD
jgi:uncharacterized membrane protein YbaN (DUF454 family)